MNPSRLKFALVLRCNYDLLIREDRKIGLHGEGVSHFNKYLLAAVDAIRRFGPNNEIAVAKKALEEWQGIQENCGGPSATLKANPYTDCQSIEYTMRRFERYLEAFTDRQFFELETRVN